jgi:hypothetical protein
MRFSDAQASVDHENWVYLDLFIQHTRKQLEAELLQSMRSSIDKAIDQAIRDMQAQIEQQYDVARHRTAVILTVRKVT